MIKLKLGEVYQLPHGKGVLLGKEMFDEKGNTVKPLSTNLENGNEFTRYIFRIDSQSKWSKLMNSTKYAAWGTQIQEVE